MSERQVIARNYFTRGHNCAQSVLLAYSDKLQMNEKELRAITSGFGGGMGKLQLTCGSVTGAFMVFSLLAEKKSKDNAEAKELANSLIQEFERKFVAETGSLSCMNILGVDMNTVEGMKIAREKDLFATVCVDAVKNAVATVDEIIINKNL